MWHSGNLKGVEDNEVGWLLLRCDKVLQRDNRRPRHLASREGLLLIPEGLLAFL